MTDTSDKPRLAPRQAISMERPRHDREGVLACVAEMRAANQPCAGDSPAITQAKATVAALCDAFQHTALDEDGARRQLDIAHHVGRVFGAIVRARRLTPAGAALAVEELAVAFGNGAGRQAL